MEGPIVDFKYKFLIFCHCFLHNDAKKLHANWTLTLTCSGVMLTLPIAVFKHKTFFIWNFIVAFISSHLATISSFWSNNVGNLPALSYIIICIDILKEIYIRNDKVSSISVGNFKSIIYIYRKYNILTCLNLDPLI